jgi:2-polyprenyl-6-methoxyphenol hydroxylase-like FAD-dependent oxidoreductase
VGTSVALELRRAGREVLLVDAGASVNKVCGEGLLPPGWIALQALGVADLIEDKAPISELVYQMPDPRDGRLRAMTATIDRPSFGVRREVLCRAFARASSECGLEVWRPARFRGVRFGPTKLHVQLEREGPVQVDCRYLVGADGLHSRVRREVGLESPEKRRFSRWGTRIYVRGRPHKGVVVTLGDGVESYMTPLAADLSGLSFIWDPRRLGRPLPGDGPSWHRLIDGFPACFRESLPGEDAFFGPEQAIGPLQQRVLSPLHRSGRIALVGDAGGYLDALTGEGLCLGMLQAQALSRLMLEGRLDLYPRCHRAIKMRHHLVVNALLGLFAHSALKERVYAGLYGTPGMLQALVGVAVEHAPWYRLLRPELLRFLRLTFFGSLGSGPE